MITTGITISIMAFLMWLFFGWLYYTDKINPFLAYFCGGASIAIGVLFNVTS